MASRKLRKTRFINYKEPRESDIDITKVPKSTDFNPKNELVPIEVNKCSSSAFPMIDQLLSLTFPRLHRYCLICHSYYR